MDKLVNKIAGAVYGMAIGDSMGMPSELWGREKVRSFFGKITDFQDGPKENDVAMNYKKGEYTDDTAQALVIVDSLIEKKFVPDAKDVGLKLIDWADREGVWEFNILGPTSKATLNAIKDGKDPKPFSKKALSNGSAMRIAPVGTLFKPDQINSLAKYVADITAITHSSDVGVAGAAIIAMAVACGIHDLPFTKLLENIYKIEPVARLLGSETFSASFKKRIEIGIQIANKFDGDDMGFLNEIYDVVGAGVGIIQSVPAAISIAYYSKSVKQCALLCANLAGDTDTIGAMACAIVGAYKGYEGIDKYLIETINNANPLNILDYGKELAKGTEITWKL